MEVKALRLTPPTFIYLESPDGQKSAKVDLFVTNRMLLDAGQQPSETERWNRVREWIAKILEIPLEEISESMAVFLFNNVQYEVKRVNEGIKKDVFQTVSSDASIQASPETTENGTKK